MDNVWAGVIGASAVGGMTVLKDLWNGRNTNRVQEWEQWRKDCEVLRADIKRLEEKVDLLTKDRDTAMALQTEYKDRLKSVERERDKLRTELDEANIRLSTVATGLQVREAIEHERIKWDTSIPPPEE